MTDKEQVTAAAAQIQELLEGARPAAPELPPATVEECHQRLMMLRGHINSLLKQLWESSNAFYHLCQVSAGEAVLPIAYVVVGPLGGDDEFRVGLDLRGENNLLLQAVLAQASAAYARSWRAVRAVADEADYLCSERIPALLNGEAKPTGH